MAITSGEVNLSRYRCAKCARTPEKANELFTGCSCGHRLFRLRLHPPASKRAPVPSDKSTYSKEDMEFLTIRERKIGIYDINVDELLKREPQKKKSPVIAGNNGVYSIRLDSTSKKQ
jgi:predicted  nucleic acid-binding Zn-ribbon protein